MNKAVENKSLPAARKPALLKVLQLIRERKNPEQLTVKNLKGNQIGEPSKVRVSLERLGLIDKESRLTPLAAAMRTSKDEDATAALKTALELAYAPILSINAALLDPDTDDEAARVAIEAAYTLIPKSTVDRNLACFSVLKKLYLEKWNFAKVSDEAAVKSRQRGTSGATKGTESHTLNDRKKHAPKHQPHPAREQRAIKFAVNITLKIEATSDYTVYDNFFKAMAKHLKTFSGETGE